MINNFISNNRFRNFYQWILICLSMLLRSCIPSGIIKQAKDLRDESLSKADDLAKIHKDDAEKRAKEFVDENIAKIKKEFEKEQEGLRGVIAAEKEDFKKILEQEQVKFKQMIQDQKIDGQVEDVKEQVKALDGKMVGISSQLKSIQTTLSSAKLANIKSQPKDEVELFQYTFDFVKSQSKEENSYYYTNLQTLVDGSASDFDKLKTYINTEFETLIEEQPKDYALILYLLSLKKDTYIVKKDNATKVLKDSFIDELNAYCKILKAQKVVLDVFNKAKYTHNNNPLAQLCSKVMVDNTKTIKAEYKDLIPLQIANLNLSDNIAQDITYAYNAADTDNS